MISRDTRVDRLELMDLGDFGAMEYQQTLEELELINRLTDGYTPTLRAVSKFASKYARCSSASRQQPLKILDVGCGYGDTLRMIAKWSRKKNISVELIGIDSNPDAVFLATAATDPEFPIRYITCSSFDTEGLREVLHPSSGKVDIIINSLFMHHLKDAEIPDFIRWMTLRSRLGWFINDLHRHPLAYHFIGYFSRLFGFSRMICHDAPLSVARSFSRADWIKFLTAADIPLSAAQITWHWSFRYGILFEHTGSAPQHFTRERGPE
jgi:SAM-dependent methyltransferase